MAYVGKITELVGGLLLAIGLFTRPAVIALVINMAVITFIMGNGKILSDDQHPFLLLLLFAVFFFTGAGMYSLDYLLFDKAGKKLSDRSSILNNKA
jgi:putative oxidoreductase